jgi:glycosyltransferase involved in cell wall biosynthesis
MTSSVCGLSIALVTETWAPEINGVAMTLGRLVGGLARCGHRVQVVRPSQGREDGVCAVDHPLVSELVRPGLPLPGYQALRLGLPSSCALVGAWRQRRPDVVHIATEGPLGASALSAATALALPVTSSYHTNFDDYAKHYRLGFLRPLAKSWLRSFHNRTLLTLVPSVDLVGRLTADGFRNCALWSRGVDIEAFNPARRDPAVRAAWGVADGEVACLHVGRVAAEKDIPLAIGAFSQIRATQPGARMVVAGDGPMLAALRRGHPEIIFTGRLDEAALAAAYASADLFLFPSRSETFGNVLCEAMASGLPAVGFDYAAAAMHGRDGLNMRTVPFDRPDRFAEVACALAADAALRHDISVQARTDMLGNAWAPVVERFAGCLTDVVQRELGLALERLSA